MTRFEELKEMLKAYPNAHLERGDAGRWSLYRGHSLILPVLWWGKATIAKAIAAGLLQWSGSRLIQVKR